MRYCLVREQTPTMPPSTRAKCFGFIISATKWLPVLVTCSIFAWGWYAYNFLFIPGLDTLAIQVVYVLAFHLLYILSIWSYLRTTFAPAIKIPSKFFLSPEASEYIATATSEEQRDSVLAFVVKKNDLPVACRSYSGGFRYCEKCNLIKPDRCHHCSICGACILRMDHHCPWINNCVSFANHKFFVLFLGYTFTLCAFTGATTFSSFMKYWSLPESPYKNNINNNSTSYGSNTNTRAPLQEAGALDHSFVPLGVRFHILFLFFVSTMLSMGVVFLYCYHIHLLLNNRSTLESFRPALMTYGPDRNAFNLGKRENFYQLFGRSPLRWFIPIHTTEGTGIFYNQRPQLGANDEEARQELLNPVASNTPQNGSEPDATNSEMVNKDTKV